MGRSFTELEIKSNTREDIEEAFESWLVENAGIIRRYAINARVIGMDLDDVIQNINIACWHAAEKYSASREAKFSTFAVKCIQNEVAEMRRAESTNKRQFEKTACSIDDTTPEGIPLAEISTSYSPSVEDVVIGLGTVDIIGRVLLSFSERNRKIIKKAFAGYSQDYISGLYGITQPCVSSICAEFRNALRAELEKENYLPAS